MAKLDLFKNFFVPDDQFFATAMRSPQGRKRLETAIRKDLSRFKIGGMLTVAFLAFISSKLATNISLQIKFPDQNISDSLFSSFFFFGLFVSLICLSIVRWHTLTTELKFIAAWPASLPYPTSEATVDLPNAKQEVKS
jgi:hypothetical protein